MHTVPTSKHLKTIPRFSNLGPWGNLAYPFRFGFHEEKTPDDGGSNPPGPIHPIIRFINKTLIQRLTMAEVQKLKSVKRFGARYGRRPKYKLAKIESILRSKQKCPYCCKEEVKRVAVGIWQCKKCNTKFTGKAYSIAQKSAKGSIEVKEEEPVSQDEEAE